MAFQKTILCDLESMRYVYKIAKYKKVTIQMDITYWDRNFGLMVVRDALIGVVLWHKYVTHETIAYYVEGIEWLKSKGFKIYGVVIDGMKGLPQALKPIKVLMCQFHQILTGSQTSNQDLDIESYAEQLKQQIISLR